VAACGLPVVSCRLFFFSSSSIYFNINTLNKIINITSDGLDNANSDYY